MSFTLAAAGIAAGSQLLSTWYSGRSAKKQTAKTNRINQIEAAKNREYQKEFAQKGIGWKVDDARKAGIHPLAAINASTPMYTPTSANVVADSSSADMAKNMGQDISRAVKAGMNRRDRELQRNQQTRLNELQIENQSLENELLKKRLRDPVSATSLPSPTSGLPGYMHSGGGQSYIEGQGDSGPMVQEIPARRTKSYPGYYHQEAGHVADTGFAQTSTGLAPIPSRDVKERIEDQMIPEAMWTHRNYVQPNLNPTGKAPPKSYLPKGAIGWKWNVFEWQPIYVPSKVKLAPRVKKHYSTTHFGKVEAAKKARDKRRRRMFKTIKKSFYNRMDKY